MPKHRFSDTSRDYANRSICALPRRSSVSLALVLGLLVLASGCSNRQELNWADYRKVSAAENNAKAPSAPATGRPFGSGPMPFGSGMMPFGSGAMPYGSGMMPYGSGFMPYGSGMMPFGSGAMPYGSGMMPFGSGSMPYGSGAMPMGFAPGAAAFPFGSGSPLGSFPPNFNSPTYTTRTSAGPNVGRFPKYGTPYPTIQ